MTGLQHGQVTIAGAPVHVVTAGPPDAPGLLLLHGWLSAAGCTAVGEPAAIPDGARRGSLFAYVQDPDGVTVELIELIPQPSKPEDPS